MNVITTLVNVKTICEAYGAKLNFAKANLPIICILPTTNGEVVRCFADELYNTLGLWCEVNGQEVTFTLS